MVSPFVASENLTVMVSLFENPDFGVTSESLAFIEVMNGPGLTPKLPTNNTDVEVEGNDVPSLFLSAPSILTVMTISTLGTTSVLAESIIVIVRVDGFIQVPT